MIIMAERQGEQLCWPEPWTRFSAGGRRDGPIVTGTPCPALADPGPAWLALSGKQTPRSTEAFLRFADRGHGPGIPPDAGVNKLRLS